MIIYDIYALVGASFECFGCFDKNISIGIG